jgi:hypothetical protein
MYRLSVVHLLQEAGLRKAPCKLMCPYLDLNQIPIGGKNNYNAELLMNSETPNPTGQEGPVPINIGSLLNSVFAHLTFTNP